MQTACSIKFANLTRETTQVTTVTQEGKPRAEAGRNTQTNNTSDHKPCESGKAAKASDLATQRTRPHGKYFEKAKALLQSGGVWVWRCSGSWWLRGAINQRRE